jgi:hypothetical protein
METTITPNAPQSTGTEQSAVPSMDSIAAKMTLMRESTLRNQLRQQPEQTATGQDESAETSSPVAPNSDSAVPEVADSDNQETVSDNYEAEAQNEDSVSTDSSNSTADELIDFIEFADANPNAKFKFMKNGKEVIVDAKKAAAILGQGSAIHEEARQLKIERAEFDEYINEARARQEGLTLAMEFTVQPQLRKAYDEIVKTQNYQTTFQQQLAQTRDPAHVARIQASMQQNEQYIRQQQDVIGQLKPAVDQFRHVRGQQVVQRLEESRKAFVDKELKNEYVFNEVREKLSKVWKEAKGEIIPGIQNIDIVSSDEALLSLVRDGLRYRDKPNTKSSGASIAALTNRKGSSTQKSGGDDITKLREQAKSGDKKAGDNLLVAQLQRLRQARGGR